MLKRIETFNTKKLRHIEKVASAVGDMDTRINLINREFFLPTGCFSRAVMTQVRQAIVKDG